MKIAVVTEDGRKISSHFGMAPWYRVFTVDEGQIVADEMREKPHHQAHQHHHGHEHGHEHGCGSHGEMFAPLQDCDVVIAGGLGAGAVQRLADIGVELILAGGQVEEAVAAYLRGELKSDPRRIHRH